MEPKTEHVPADPSLVQKVAPTVIAALIVAAIGSGIITWHISDSNSLRITKLEQFANRGERCTYRDCQRIELMLRTLRLDLRSHEEQAAHREAAERFRVLQEQVKEFEEHMKNNP